MYSVKQIAANIRNIVNRDILAQESGYQWELVRQLYNAFGFEDKADISRFQMEKKAATGRIDVFDSANGVVWEMKRSALNVLNTKGVHNKGHEAITPSTQATNYMKSVQSEVAITTNGFQFYRWNAKEEMIDSIDFTSEVSDTAIASFFVKCFGGSNIDLFVEAMTKNLDTLLDNFLDKSDRKTSAAYWSNIKGARKLFHDYLVHLGWYDELKSANDVESLKALWTKVITTKVFDPTVGGCALLVAAQTELCILEREIEHRLTSLGEVVDPYINVRPENFYGIEKYDAQYAEAVHIAQLALTKFDAFGGFKKPASPYNILKADSLDTNWREFVSPGEVIIFANPPFTGSSGFNDDQTDEQKLQMKKFGARHSFDAAFVLKAAEEQMYDGVWILNYSTTFTNYKKFNELFHTDFCGRIHECGGDKIANGGQAEAWIFTSEGEGGIREDVSSRTQLTDWVVLDGCIFSGKPSSEGVECETFGGRVVRVSDKYTFVGEDDFVLSRATGRDSLLSLRRISKNYTTGNMVARTPTEWTLRVFDRIFGVWSNYIEPAAVLGFGKSVYQSCPTLSRSFNTFPLFQGDDLTHYDSMSDDEIFSELYQKYLKLINK